MLGKLLTSLTQPDIEALLDNRVGEDSTLDYKRDLPSTNDQRRDIVYDIAALANTRGGDIVFGVDEERDSNDKPMGVPREILGVPQPNLDSLKLGVLRMLEDCSKPRINGVEFAAVGTFKQGPVVIIRVPPSWNGPHMVQYEKTQRFYGRSSAGKFLMEIDQIRAAMLASASLSDRLDAFRRDRVLRIAANDGPHTLSAGAIMLFHVVPFASITGTNRVDSKTLSQLEVPGISMAGGGSPRFNFDGYLLPCSNSDGAGVGYVQAFRSGVVESVMSRLTEGAPPCIGSEWFEKKLVKSTMNAVHGLRRIGVPGPYYVAITFLGVRDAYLSTSNERRVGPIDRDMLLLPEIQIEDALEPRSFASALQPALDVVWQSAGAARSHNFDDNGVWRVRGI